MAKMRALACRFGCTWQNGRRLFVWHLLCVLPRRRGGRPALFGGGMCARLECGGRHAYVDVLLADLHSRHSDACGLALRCVPGGVQRHRPSLTLTVPAFVFRWLLTAPPFCGRTAFSIEVFWGWRCARRCLRFGCLARLAGTHDQPKCRLLLPLVSALGLDRMQKFGFAGSSEKQILKIPLALRPPALVRRRKWSSPRRARTHLGTNSTCRRPQRVGSLVPSTLPTSEVTLLFGGGRA